MLMSRIKHQRKWNLLFDLWIKWLVVNIRFTRNDTIIRKNIEHKEKRFNHSDYNSDESVEYSAFGNYLPLDRAIQESLIDADVCIICVVGKIFSWLWSMIKAYIYLTLIHEMVLVWLIRMAIVY